MKSVLVLEDGTYYTGKAFGKEGEVFGEVVFNTCMTGYQEVLTDPAYNGQIVAMTYPLIGNYGFNSEDAESARPYVQGLVVKELCESPSSWRSLGSLEEYFLKHNITGIRNIDTRALTHHIRRFGSMFGVISTVSGNIDVLLEKIRKEKQKRRELVMEVTRSNLLHVPGTGKKVALLDFGVMNKIIGSLSIRNCDIYILPANFTAREIMEYDPDGVLLSSGPGSPEDLPSILKSVKELVGKKPIFGIGLGHQLLGLALGGSIRKLSFGHHGGNYPVKDHITGRCYITLQNHDYVIDKFTNDNVVITHTGVNDNTIEGFMHKSLLVLGTQFYPETEPEKGDSAHIFDIFIKMMG